MTGAPVRPRGDGPILVTGGTGQLAGALVRAGGAAMHRVGRPEFDFDRPETIAAILRRVAPRAVVNAAAWTAVDAAEAEPVAAARANRDGPAALAALCTQAGVPLIHVSTDYVFDGLKGAPYTELDAPRPTGVYGHTKLDGEQAVRAACAEALVLRTSWVHAPEGKNFVRTMLNAARRGAPLRVVADQIGCPTSADDLAAVILALLDQGWDTGRAGIYHAAGTGWTSWHGFAEAIIAEGARHGLVPVPVLPIRTEDWPTPARRPPDSRLDCGKLHAGFGLALPDWRDGLRRAIDASHLMVE